MPDNRALRTLFDTYWSPSGWRPEGERLQNPGAIEHAKRCGVMFEPTIIDHDEVITRLISARDRLNPRLVGDAFLASLTTRRLDLRSALGSYSVFRHMPVHRANSAVGACSVCGLFGSSGQSEDLNVLNFERFKWGGVRHDQPLYATLDLELLLKERPPHPTNEDIRLLKLILEALRDAPPSTTSAQVQRFLPKALKSNK
ncbi:MAG TPA: hypothetical protein VFQ61_01425, partial [Polyangiaceae bacterium]|nr:hypothetical protein [Polyangiaceae bacterium]